MTMDELVTIYNITPYTLSPLGGMNPGVAPGGSVEFPIEEAEALVATGLWSLTPPRSLVPEWDSLPVEPAEHDEPDAPATEKE